MFEMSLCALAAFVVGWGVPIAVSLVFVRIKICSGVFCALASFILQAASRDAHQNWTLCAPHVSWRGAASARGSSFEQQGGQGTVAWQFGLSRFLSLSLALSLPLSLSPSLSLSLSLCLSLSLSLSPSLSLPLSLSLSSCSLCQVTRTCACGGLCWASCMGRCERNSATQFIHHTTLNKNCVSPRAHPEHAPKGMAVQLTAATKVWDAPFSFMRSRQAFPLHLRYPEFFANSQQLPCGLLSSCVNLRDTNAASKDQRSHYGLFPRHRLSFQALPNEMAWGFERVAVATRSNGRLQP